MGKCNTKKAEKQHTIIVFQPIVTPVGFKPATFRTGI